MLTDMRPALYWLATKTFQFAHYLERWIIMLDPGEDDK